MSGPPVSVPEDVLRQFFADERVLERATAGELREQVKSSHRAPASDDWPPDTESQIVAYVDSNGQTIAEAHRYLKPDGSIGASGMPDPKFVRTADGRRYFKP